jgi:hypothetical protein
MIRLLVLGRHPHSILIGSRGSIVVVDLSWVSYLIGIFYGLLLTVSSAHPGGVL